MHSHGSERAPRSFFVVVVFSQGFKGHSLSRTWVGGADILVESDADCGIVVVVSDEVVSTLGEGTFGKVLEVRDLQK